MAASTHGGQPFVCSDYHFFEETNSGNYVGAGFTIANANGYVSAMGYSTEFDWLFIPSETLGNTSLPVGDYAYVSPDLIGYKIARLGGGWGHSGLAGGFFWATLNGVDNSGRDSGGRLVYIPVASERG